MNIQDVSVPQVYREESADFRFFIDWFSKCLSKVQYDTENLPDLYDCLRCPEWLLWMLGDTMGFKYDDRFPAAFNRLVLLYFMSMIRHKGSKDGVTLAAEVNLAQFNIFKYGAEDSILYNRLEDTSIPVNAVYVNPHVDEGYIDVVYFSENTPQNACIEYVRPVGMYLFEHAGVRVDSRMKISIDSRLTNSPTDLNMSIGPTHVGHYSRKDYSRLQQLKDDEVTGTLHDVIYSDGSVHAEYSPTTPDYRLDPVLEPESYSPSDGKTKREKFQEKMRANSDEYGIPNVRQPYEAKRNNVYYRNSDFEKSPTPNSIELDLNGDTATIHNPKINPGYRALYSLQISNNEHIVKSLIPSVELKPIFGLGFTPNSVAAFDNSEFVDYPNPDGSVSSVLPDIYKYPDKTFKESRVYNLRYDKTGDENVTEVSLSGPDVWLQDDSLSGSYNGIPGSKPRPAVNPFMISVGDAVSMNEDNSKYSLVSSDSGSYPITSDPGTDSGKAKNIKIYRVKTDGEFDPE